VFALVIQPPKLIVEKVSPISLSPPIGEEQVAQEEDYYEEYVEV
jgi:hypothetical protein